MTLSEVTLAILGLPTDQGLAASYQKHFRQVLICMEDVTAGLSCMATLVTPSWPSPQAENAGDMADTRYRLSQIHAALTIATTPRVLVLEASHMVDWPLDQLAPICCQPEDQDLVLAGQGGDAGFTPGCYNRRCQRSLERLLKKRSLSGSLVPGALLRGLRIRYLDPCERLHQL